MRVPFWSMHHSGLAQGGWVPAGSSPASLSNNATTPCAGTFLTVMLRTTVPLSVWAHKSYIINFSIVLSDERNMTYANGVLPSCANPGRFSQTEEHIGRMIENIKLIRRWTVKSGSRLIWYQTVRTSMKTVPSLVSPLQYCAGWVELLVQSGWSRSQLSSCPSINY